MMTKTPPCTTRRIVLRDPKGAIAGFADRREGIGVCWTKVPAAQ